MVHLRPRELSLWVRDCVVWAISDSVALVTDGAIGEPYRAVVAETAITERASPIVELYTVW